MKDRYIKKPNLPQTKASVVLVDYRINPVSEKKLKELGIKVLKTKKLSSLYEAVNGHPDMQFHHLGDNLFVCEKTLVNYYKSLLPDAIIIPSTNELCAKYPYDIALNGARISNHFFHYLNYTDCEILEYYKTNGVKLINVKQGYTKCSVCVINENAIITSDIKINNIALKNDINSLYFKSDKIILKGLNNGFIGGICGLIGRNTLAVNGDINKLADNKGFLDFCEKNRTNVLQLNNLIPEDIGSIIPIKETLML